MTLPVKSRNFRIIFFPNKITLIFLSFILSVVVSYQASIIFFDFINNSENNNSLKKIEQSIKKNLQVKIFIKFFVKLIKNWFDKVWEKLKLLFKTAKITPKILTNWIKSILELKNKFQSWNFISQFMEKFESLLVILDEIKQIFLSFRNEILSLFNIIPLLYSINFIKKLHRIFSSLSQDFEIIALLMNGFYMLFASILGVIIGFIIAAYKRKDKINFFNLYKLLKTFYKTIIKPLFIVLLLYFFRNMDATSKIRWKAILDGFDPDMIIKVTQFDKFSGKFIPKINQRLPRIILQKSTKDSSIPFPIIEDPIIEIEIWISENEEECSKIEFTKFYKNNKLKRIYNK